ncbi:FIG00841528: hypothetical protein [hydrothermal vent metagenome]|uniref:Uncharacterized protein n=1 Tax=hydrothermal vent metagenome TaxID=652676 RepID=A0A3B0WV39_9ZZZZ
MLSRNFYRTQKNYFLKNIRRFFCVTFVLAISTQNSLASSFVTFESGHVTPLAKSPDGSQLFSVNTPDNHLEIFNIKTDGLVHIASIPVGLEPVSVATRSNDEVWVVNHLSDSISIIDLTTTPPRVVRTLLVGDEPRDILFAGTSGNRAFITTAHRGQSSPYMDATNPAEATTEGIGRADVWVFDATKLGNSLNGDPLTIITLFGDTPRALTKSIDGSTVYAAIFHSGNQTTVLHDQAVCNSGATAPTCTAIAGELQSPGGLPAPNQNVQGLRQPETGIIVKHNGTNWVDELDRSWDNMVRFDLPDLDVFSIDANANPPIGTNAISGVGTILYNMAVNPATGEIFVSNTEAINQVRFEGERTPTRTATTVQGHIHETRISIIDPETNSVTSRHLNKHINYDEWPASSGTSDKSLSLPRDMAFSADGTKLYIAAKGSNKVALFDTAKLRNNSFQPDSANHVEITGGGPSGLVFDETSNKLYVTTRFDNGISVIDTNTLSETNHYVLHNPEPQQVIDGRPFMYDARLTSSNGESPCASCHVDGDLDSLAWDLGNPEGTLITNPGPFLGPFGDQPGAPPFFYKDYHPMKGPMTTQTLRGMENGGAMHWRGDRTGGNDEATAQPDGGTFNEDLAFKKFNVAFPGLLGRSDQLSDAQMQQFTDFVLEMQQPPNPIRALDNSLTPMQSAGSDFYFNVISLEDPDPIKSVTCNGCHIIDPANGFFGTDGSSSFEAETQRFKIPHLRNMYSKIGMFGMADLPFFESGNNAHKGDQIRGFGFMHDGSVDSLFRFVSTAGFDFPGSDRAAQDAVRRQVEQFMLALDSDMKPAMGQQITLTDKNTLLVSNRIDLLVSRAAVGECDLVVQGTVSNENRGWMRLPSGKFQSDNSNEAELTEVQLRQLAQTVGQTLTFTCVPPEASQLVANRIALDRDEDGILNNNDVCPAITNPLQIDTDADGIGDACDNCTILANADQNDSNGDGYGNRCDGDLNNNGAVNFADLGLFKSKFNSSDADADFNSDGAVNFADLGIFKTLFGKAPGPSALQP